MDRDLHDRLDRLSTTAAMIPTMRWCDAERFLAENSEGVSPGQYLNRFGWWALGTTIGGDAIVVAHGDPAVYFAGHDWYFDDLVSYEDLRNGGDKWCDGPLTDAVSASLFMLAATSDDFTRAAKAGEIDAILMRIS